ncbi:hypothetical protein [Peribacillus frigoritolerans]|uniref:hypothetical protein n=1 Tax=Peribacillus frigoritolerans TaxID=450367 RepID=UPI0039A1D5D6
MRSKVNLQLGKKVTAQEISEWKPGPLSVQLAHGPILKSIKGVVTHGSIMSDDLFSSTKRERTIEEATHEGMTSEVYEEKKHPLW